LREKSHYDLYTIPEICLTNYIKFGLFIKKPANRISDLDPRVQDRVEDVRQQVREDDADGEYQRHPHHRRKIEVLDRLVRVEPYARPVEDRLDHDRAAEEPGEEQAEDRHRRDEKDRDRDGRKDRDAQNRISVAATNADPDDRNLAPRSDIPRHRNVQNGDDGLGKRRRPADDDVSHLH